EVRAGLLEGNRQGKRAVAVSALTGEGFETLLERIGADVSHDNISLDLSLDASDGAGLAWAYRHAEVVKRRERAGRIALSLRISPQNASRFQDRFLGKIKHSQRTKN
ncbi:MAG: hypothetical protein ABI963_01415, partial [Rhizomicrobium sp.]